MRIIHYSFDDNRSVTMKGFISKPIEGIASTDCRPAVLILPGGGYDRISSREGEPIALKYLSKGFNAFVLSYPVKTPMPEVIKACAWAMATIRNLAEVHHINPKKVAVCGFSAGAHLAGMISTLKDGEVNLKTHKNISLVPDACVLCYPVIDGGEYAHKGSFDNICVKESDREAYSIQNRITESAPPAFIWSTASDETVPVQNSLLAAKAFADNGVPFELHIFESGKHGLAACEWQTAYDESEIKPECSEWFELSIKFLEKYLNK